MLVDVDRSLVALVERRAGLGDGTDVVVATPSGAWASTVSRPAVALWLHALREDVARRSADWHEVRDPSGRVSGRQAPLRRYRLHYAVTAWAASDEEEHGLLAKVLACLAAADVFPADCLVGALSESTHPVVLDVALSGDAAIPLTAWAALGTEPRLALDVVVSAVLSEPPVVDVGPPVQSRSITVAAPHGPSETLRGAARRGGE